MDIPQPPLPSLFALGNTGAENPHLLELGCEALTAADHWSAATGADTAMINTLVTELDGRAPVMAVLGPTGLVWEPFGETPYLELVSIYAQRALALRDAGAKLLLLCEMPSLGESRAAVIGARQSGLPILVLLRVTEEGRTEQDADLLASIVTLQELGIAAVGFDCPSGRIDTLQLLGKVAPYATVPLLVRLDDSADATAYGEYVTQALRAGAGLFALSAQLGPEQVRAVRQAIDSFGPGQCVITKEEDRLILACDNQPFFLSDGHMEFSEPILCSLDMSEEIISAEDEGCDVLTIRLETVEDAYNFGLNVHMVRVPICLTSDREEALECALIYYCGRAMVDSLSEIETARIRELAQGYGAVVV